MSIKSKIKTKIKAWIYKILGASETSGGTPPPPTPQPPTTDAPSVPVGTDALPWETINWEGQNQAKNALPTKLLRSVTIYGDNRVMLDYDTNTDWPRLCRAVEDCHSSFMVFTTAIDGALRGGHIDHMRPNAKERDLGNLYNGYIMSDVPRGKDLYIAIASHDGKYRSNMVKAIRK